MNWYKKAQLTHALEKEAAGKAGKREIFIVLLSLLSGGLAVQEAQYIRGLLDKYNIPEFSITNPAGKSFLEDLTPEDVQQLIGSEEAENAGARELPNGMPSAGYVKDMITRHEDSRSYAYKDSKGIPTVGVGFNLTRQDAKAKLKSMGIDINKVLSRKQKLEPEQIDALLDADVLTAISDAQSFIGNFGEQPTIVKTILIDMAFNMGSSTLGKFVSFKAGLESRDYKRASQEMVNSDWYGQTGDRSKELVGMMNYVSNFYQQQ